MLEKLIAIGEYAKMIDCTMESINPQKMDKRSIFKFWREFVNLQVHSVALMEHYMSNPLQLSALMVGLSITDSISREVLEKIEQYDNEFHDVIEVSNQAFNLEIDNFKITLSNPHFTRNQIILLNTYKRSVECFRDQNNLKSKRATRTLLEKLLDYTLTLPEELTHKEFSILKGVMFYIFQLGDCSDDSLKKLFKSSKTRNNFLTDISNYRRFRNQLRHCALEHMSSDVIKCEGFQFLKDVNDCVQLINFSKKNNKRKHLKTDCSGENNDSLPSTKKHRKNDCKENDDTAAQLLISHTAIYEGGHPVDQENYFRMEVENSNGIVHNNGN